MSEPVNGNVTLVFYLLLSVTICEPNTNCPTHTHERQSTVEHAQHPFTRTRRASVGSVQSDYTQNKPRPVFSTYLRATAHAHTPPRLTRSGIRQGQGSSRLHVSARTPVHAPRARGLICGRSPEARRHANYVRHVVPRGPVRVRYPTVPPNPPLTYPLPLIPVFELVAHEIDSDRTSRALRPP